MFAHRHQAEIEQELGLLGPTGTGAAFETVDFLPHLIPMTRGILAAAHIRPTRPVTTAELRSDYARIWVCLRQATAGLPPRMPRIWHS